MRSRRRSEDSSSPRPSGATTAATAPRAAARSPSNSRVANLGRRSTGDVAQNDPSVRRGGDPGRTVDAASASDVKTGRASRSIQPLASSGRKQGLVAAYHEVRHRFSVDGRNGGQPDGIGNQMPSLIIPRLNEVGGLAEPFDRYQNQHRDWRPWKDPPGSSMTCTSTPIPASSTLRRISVVRRWPSRWQRCAWRSSQQVSAHCSDARFSRAWRTSWSAWRGRPRDRQRFLGG